MVSSLSRDDAENLGYRREQQAVLAGEPLRRDVDHRRDTRDDGPVATQDGSGTLGDPRPAAVRTDQLDLLVGDGLAPNGPRERPVLGPKLVAVLIESAVLLAARDLVELAPREAEDRLEPVVGEQDPAARRLGDHQAFRRLLEDGLEAGSLAFQVGQEALANAGQRDAGERLGAQVRIGADVVSVDLVEPADVAKRHPERSERDPVGDQRHGARGLVGRRGDQGLGDPTVVLRCVKVGQPDRLCRPRGRREGQA